MLLRIKSEILLFLCKIRLHRMWYLIKKGKVDKYQTNQLVKLLNWVKRHNKYYETFLPNKITNINVYNCISKMPTLTKSLIRNNTSSIFSDFVHSDYVSWQNTGGSTGEPLKFPIGYSLKRVNSQLELYHQLFLIELMGGTSKSRIASIDGVRVDAQSIQDNKFWIKNRMGFPWGQYRYSTLFLNEDTFPFYLAHFNKYKPEILRGYPSGIKTFCHYIEKNKSSLLFQIKACYLTSENIDKDTSDYISSVLKCDVWGQYGHSEGSVFGYKKPGDERYYLSPFYGYTEILDNEDCQVKMGEMGEIVVTGFANRAMPFIRYKTGDLAIFGGRDEKGFIIIEKLLGRTVDYIVDSNYKKIFLVGLIFGGHLKCFNYIDTWQIVQDSPGIIDIKVVCPEDNHQTCEEELLSFFKRNSIIARVQFVRSVDKTKSGKQRFLIQNYII